MPQTPWNVGDVVEGFAVRQITPLTDLDAVAIQLEHPASGARVLHIHGSDSENLFSVAFPTIPPNNTGLPHILEHSVLSGSKKFPVKEPFFEMIKMSMATFINALTGPDMTYYPVSSNNRQDLFNLAEVYFDAVFHPLLSLQTFQREAHHLAPADPKNPTGGLTINGIVFNEMKGAYSHPESFLYRQTVRLFPDTVYGLDYGGDPDAIPDVTHEDLLRFHRRFYHPANAMFVLYGDIPTADYLRFLGPKLEAIPRGEPAPVITPQRRWDRPRRWQGCYPLGADEPADARAYLKMLYLWGEATDPREFILLDVLGRILIGNEAAPLKKAIIDSKLGQDLVQSGFDPVGLESVFHLALKGAEADRVEAFEKLVMGTLEKLAVAPIDASLVEAAFQQAAYHHLEIVSQFPFHLMNKILQAWPYGADALTFARMREHLTACRQSWLDDPALFSRLIRQRLLDNPHRMTIVLAADRQEQARRDEAFSRKMADVRRRLSDEQARRIAEESAELDRHSGEPNSPASLAGLPQLKIGDLPASPRHIPTTVQQLAGGVTILRNDVFSNGVEYLVLDFDLAGLDEDLWAYLPRYADAVQKCGAAGKDFQALAKRLAAHTGGISCRPYFTTAADSAATPLRRMSVSLRTLDHQIPPALDVLRDVVLAVDPRDADRLGDVVQQSLAWYRTELIHNGMTTAMLHAARGLSAEGFLTHLTGGLPQLMQTRRLSGEFDRQADGLMRRIEAIRDFLSRRARMTASFTGSAKSYDAVCREISRWPLAQSGSPAATAATIAPPAHPRREGLAGPIDVAFCVQVLPAPHYSDADEPLMQLGCHLAGMDYLLTEIRLKGNAYGGGCRYDPLGRTLAMYSYRDPHIRRTLDVFAGLAGHIRSADWTQTEIDRAIISRAKEDDEPIRPEAATRVALRRHLAGITPDLREARYRRLLEASPAAVKEAMLAMIQRGWDTSACCVVSGRQKLEQANRELTEPLAIEDIET